MPSRVPCLSIPPPDCDTTRYPAFLSVFSSFLLSTKPGRAQFYHRKGFFATLSTGPLFYLMSIHNAQPNTIIIFLTNYPQFAAEGYEVQAFRFLLKTRLDQKLVPYFQAAVEQFRSIRKTVSFTLSGEEIDIPVNDILYIESVQRTVLLHLTKPSRLQPRLYATMTAMEEQFRPLGFLRIQKSYLVNMAHIRKFQYNTVTLSNGQILTVSEKQYTKLKAQFSLWKGKTKWNIS